MESKITTQKFEFGHFQNFFVSMNVFFENFFEIHKFNFIDFEVCSVDDSFSTN